MARELDNAKVISRAADALRKITREAGRGLTPVPVFDTFRAQPDGTLLLEDGSRIAPPELPPLRKLAQE